MKSILIIISIFCITSYLHSQSSIIFESNTNINVETGADICADNIIIEGTYSGGGTKCDAPLPVELNTFIYKVSAKGRDITLLWKTDKEINNSGFDIERKTYGTNEWIKISFVAGKGNTENPVQYSYEDKKLNCGKYNYRLKQIDYNGNFEYFDLNGEVEIAAPKKFEMSQNYPNPFNPTTKIDFELPTDSKVNLKVYNILGKEISIIFNDEFKKAGYYTVYFDGSNLATGLYFYRITANDYTAIKKMVILK